MIKILILGAGAMGSAFSVPCIDRNHQVTIVGTLLEDQFIDNLNSNKKFHPILELNLSDNTNIVKYNNLEDELKKKPDLIVLGVNSKGIKWAAEQISKFSNNSILCPILLLVKGLSIYDNKYESLGDKVKRLLTNGGIKNINISAVGGPCLAKGLAHKVHTSVIFANKDMQTAKWLIDNLSTDYYHPLISNDMIGVETCAAIKNIFSMSIGAAKGLYINNDKIIENNYCNAAATLFKQSLYEMELFTNILKGKKETVNSLAGLGDLYVSAVGGRNSKMGTFLGQGYIYSEAKKLKMPNETIEGAELVFEIGTKIKNDFDIKKMPLMISVINSILDDKKLIINWNDFNMN